MGSSLTGLVCLFALTACDDGAVTTTGGGDTTTAGAGGDTTVATVTTGVTGGGSSSSGIGQPSDMYPAPHPAPPRVVDYGGPVLENPQIVPLFFQGDDPTYVTALADFASKIGATDYWTATTSEYGVGPATSSAPVNLTETAPPTIDDDGIQAWLGAKLNADDPTLPAATWNTVYVINYPAGTTIDLSGSQSCQSFGGYHSNFQLDAAHGNQQVAYAVIPRCSNFGDLSGIDAVTGTTSHELVEAATDPFPMSTPAYAEVDTQHIFWERLLGGGETGDMCAQFPDSFTKFPELDYTVQRSWSNASAKAGHDPCVPQPAGEVYFNAAPVLNENVAASFFGQPVTVKGVNIPVGETKTIDLQLFSDGDTGGPWTVSADDFSFGGTPHLELSLDETKGQNGQVLHLTIHVLSTGMKKTANFIVRSTLGNRQNIWFGIVGSPDP